uniref:Ubiquitin-like protease family profile domain-containing protein n=1 Tax=Knipowitschia caucasica TaxID=637954 RepID=A0AAV2JFQ0_KNICA
MVGEQNLYHSEGLLTHLSKFMLPYAGLWSGIMLGDLGRHGQGQGYTDASKRHTKLTNLQRQNITMANHTQGIMEKSQWDLKHLRFQSRTYSQLDDVVLQYQALHKSLLREYRDTARVFNMKQKAQPSSPGSTSTKKSQKSQLPSIYVHSPACSVRQLAHDPIYISPGPRIIKKPICLYSLWEQPPVDIVVALIRAQHRGDTIALHHSAICTLKPHDWLNGEILEALLHLFVRHSGKKVYVLSHYTAGVIVHGERRLLGNVALPRVNFEEYDGVIACVNVNNTHWTLLYVNAVTATIYLLDPLDKPTAKSDSMAAAKRFRCVCLI